MNRRLQDPFEDLDLPLFIEEVLQQGVARCIAFNHWGTVLAAGCEDGSLVLWDFETRVAAREAAPHAQAITCLAWSRCGRFVATGSRDGCTALWDVARSEAVYRQELPGVPVALSGQRQNPTCVLASFYAGPPQLVALRPGGAARALPALGPEHSSRKAGGAALFSRSGAHIFLASAGAMAVLDASSLQVLQTLQMPPARVEGLALSQCGRHLLAICGDKAIREFSVAERLATSVAERLATAHTPASRPATLEQEGKLLLAAAGEFRNPVEGHGWRAAALTSDGEHVLGASDVRAANVIFAWSRFGKRQLDVIIEGAKEGAAALAWHPRRNCMASLGDSGAIFLWARVYSERWSAFAPGFSELQDNEEYVEQEDEFDINARPEPEAGVAEDEDREVDILAEQDAQSGSDSDVGAVLRFLPLVVQPQTPPESPAVDGGAARQAGNAQGTSPLPGTEPKQDPAVEPTREERAANGERGTGEAYKTSYKLVRLAEAAT
ncbi:hypothetical protein WJX81_005607 [Elliptochloris bilobata]|uniref:Uncharacterized protein n=1 Tax=Elliptochloris bilobata TaxID=381761 RepID=A0AAW1RAC7_9CHLO